MSKYKRAEKLLISEMDGSFTIMLPYLLIERYDTRFMCRIELNKEKMR